MKKIYKESQLLELSNLSLKVIESIMETTNALNRNYGANRNVDNDLGGYVVIVVTT